MLSPPYWLFAENFPKAGRIGKSFLVLLGCPSGRYYLGTTVLPFPAESWDQNGGQNTNERVKALPGGVEQYVGTKLLKKFKDPLLLVIC